MFVINHTNVVNKNNTILHVILNVIRYKELIDGKDVNGQTPLHRAMEKQRYSRVEILLDCNAGMYICTYARNLWQL